MSSVRSSSGAGGSAPASTRGSELDSGTFVDKSVERGAGGTARASASAPVSASGTTVFSGTMVSKGSDGNASISGELPQFMTSPPVVAGSVLGSDVSRVNRGFMQSCGLGKMCAGLMLCMVSAPLMYFLFTIERTSLSDDVYPMVGLAGVVLFGCVCLTGLFCILGRKIYECVNPAFSSYA